MLEKFVQELDSMPSAVLSNFKTTVYREQCVVVGARLLEDHCMRAGAGRRSTVSER
jgi:hypothetical protein